MDLSEIPFNVPVILESHHKETSLKNPLGSKKARCHTRNRDIYEQLILHRVRDDKIAIQSFHNGRFLQVRASGECVFDPKEPGEWELFTMETDSECALYFVSCHTGNVLQCDDCSVAKCENQNRQHWEAWRIVEPRTTAMTNQAERASDQPNILTSKDRQNLVIELARCGKSPDEIQQIITNIFDGPAAASSSSFAVPVVKERKGKLTREGDADLQGDDPTIIEKKLRKFLNAYHAKVLRKACTKLGLKAQRRDFTQDNKAGYVNLLWEYYRTRVEAATERRATRHCSFQLLNVIFSDAFVERLGEAETPSRNELDIGAVNADSQYWVDIAETYNNDRQHYNGFALGEPKSQHVSVDPALAVPHVRSKLKGLWKKVVRRYDRALTKSKRSCSNAAFWDYCDGHVDALYMDDWLQIRGDRRENVAGLLPQNARMSTLSSNEEAPIAPNVSRGEAANKRRRLIVEFIREDREAGMAERQREKGGDCAVLDNLSVSVQRRALATLQALKQGHFNQEQVDDSELVLNNLVLKWTYAMAKASS